MTARSNWVGPLLSTKRLGGWGRWLRDAGRRTQSGLRRLRSFDSRLPHPSKRKARLPGAPIAPLAHDDNLRRGDFAPRGLFESPTSHGIGKGKPTTEARRHGEQPRSENQSLPRIDADDRGSGTGRKPSLLGSVFLRGLCGKKTYSLGSTIPVCFWYFPCLSL